MSKKNTIVVKGNIEISTVNNLNLNKHSEKDVEELKAQEKDDVSKPLTLDQKLEKIAEWFVGQSKDKLTFKEWMDWLKNAALIGILYTIVIYPINKYISALNEVANWWVQAARLGIGLLVLGSALQLIFLFMLNLDFINDAKRLSAGTKQLCRIVAILIFCAIFVGLSLASGFYFDKYVPNP